MPLHSSAPRKIFFRHLFNFDQIRAKTFNCFVLCGIILITAPNKLFVFLYNFQKHSVFFKTVKFFYKFEHIYATFIEYCLIDKKSLSLWKAIFNSGDSWGNRTPVTGVRGRCLNRLTNGPHIWTSVSFYQKHSYMLFFLVRHRGLEPRTR